MLIKTKNQYDPLLDVRALVTDFYGEETTTHALGGVSFQIGASPGAARASPPWPSYACCPSERLKPSAAKSSTRVAISWTFPSGKCGRSAAIVLPWSFRIQ